MNDLYLPLLLTLGACSGDKSTDTSIVEDTAINDTGAQSDTGSIDTGTTDTGVTDTGEPASPPSSFVDEDCIDGQYYETLPDANANIQSFIDSYNSSLYVDFIYGVLETRYPIGAYILDGGYTSDGLFSGNCIDLFLNNTTSADSVISSLSTLVHECGHFFDINTSDWGASNYVMTDSLSYECSDGSIPDYGGQTFARSLINNDIYAPLHPPCANYTDQGCDSYAAIYLNGDPNNTSFESGDQGFNMLQEETVQYINSLATGYAFDDQSSYSRSERDGILTFLWYTMRYLRMARLEHPQAYTLISQDTCWRESILTIWGRAWLYLEITKEISSLGINDDFLLGLVSDPDLLEEIQYLRDIQGCN